MSERVECLERPERPERLERIAEDVFAFQDDLRLPGGMLLPSRTTLVRFARTRGLLVHSPLAIDDARATAIDALGEVEVIVAPSCIHYLFLEAATKRWPRARVLGAAGLAKKVPAVPFAPLPEDGTVEGLPVRHIPGFPYIGEHVFLHAASRSLIVTDLVFNVNEARGSGIPLFLRAMGAWKKTAQSRLWRVLSRDRAAAARALRDVLAWDFERVIVAHGDVVLGDETSDAKARLASALAWILSAA